MKYQLREYWPGVGQMVDVEVVIKGETHWTTRIQQEGETIEQVIERTSKQFNKPLGEAKQCPSKIPIS